MSLHPQPFTAVPSDTARVCRAAFPKGNVYMRLHDEIGVIYQDEDFASLFSTRGKPAEAPWRLALVTLMQYAEGLSDRQAADAVRSRIDWKYALNLELTDAGFDFSVLCEFRTRLVAGNAEQLLLDTFLKVCQEHKLLKGRGRQRTDSTHVVATIRALNRLQCADETLRHALNTLAVVAPEWLRLHSNLAWVERYGPRAQDYRQPAGKEERLAYALTIGADGHALLEAIDAAEAPFWLREVPAVQTLRQVWVQQYYVAPHTLRWRAAENEGIPPAQLFINSPYDTEARYAKKRSTSWVGYKVHMTESCEEDSPPLITHVETTPAPLLDHEVVPTVHQALNAKDLLPEVHLVDSGYIESEQLVATEHEGRVELYGPPRVDPQWQARVGKGFDTSHFTIDWERQQALCPTGRRSRTWRPTSDRYGNQLISIKFATRDCRPCPHRADCTRSRAARRMLTIRPEAQFRALQQARERQTTDAYATEYAKRAGVEGTLSQAVRAFGLRRARYVGRVKTHLQHILTATAINLVRVGNWLADLPRGKTRRSPFVKLMVPIVAS
jgi:transposase